MENMFRLSNGQATTKRLKTDSEDYKAVANDCITLHLFDPSTPNSSWPPSNVSSSFKPEFTHQIFGDDEEIVGYKGLAVNIYFSQRDFQACIDIEFEDKAHGATDVFSTLQEHFPAGLTQDKQQYLAETTQNAATSFGKLGSPLPVPGAKGALSIIQANVAEGSKELKVCKPQFQDQKVALRKGRCYQQHDICLQALHERLQPFLLFFIDGASFIDLDDPKWELLLAIEQRDGRDVVVRLIRPLILLEQLRKNACMHILF